MFTVTNKVKNYLPKPFLSVHSLPGYAVLEELIFAVSRKIFKDYTRRAYSSTVL